MFKKSATTLAAACILSAVAAQATEATAPKLVLTAYINGAGGEKVLAGRASPLVKLQRSKRIPRHRVCESRGCANDGEEP